MNENVVEKSRADTPTIGAIIRLDAANVTRSVAGTGGIRKIEAGVVTGWAVCEQPIGRIDVVVGGEVVATARIGEFRADIGVLFPTLPHAQQSGFSAQLTRGRLAADGKFRLRARTVSGHVFETEETLTFVGSDATSAAAPTRMHVECCELDPNDVLKISGWALSLSPIIAVQIFGGDQRLATTMTGQIRPDLRTAFPLYPNAGEAGFNVSAKVPKSVRTQQDTIRVEVITRDGASLWMMTPILQVAKPSQQTPIPVPSHRPFPDASLRPEAMDRKPPSPRSVSPTHDEHFNCDAVVLDRGGKLHLSGWAASPTGISRISVSLAGVFIGDARLGLSRPDVGRAFPNLPGASAAGFALDATAPENLDGDQFLGVEIEMGNGTVRQFELPTQVVDAGEAKAAGGTSADIMLAVDGMQIEAGHARRAISGSFHLIGWAVARSGVASVDVFLDDLAIGKAYHGIRREDVGLAFPDYPSALTGGFALSVPSRVLRNGRSRMRVIVTDRDGRQDEVRFSFDTDKKSISSGTQALRLKMPYAEVCTHLAILEARGGVPLCDIALRLMAGDRGLQKARLTLQNLQAQSYPNWRLWLSTPQSMDAGGALRDLAQMFPTLASRLGAIIDHVPTSEPAFAAVLNAGDRLAVDGLLLLALESGGNDLVYGDDRRPVPGGSDIGAFFKPDWSPDLLLSQNYLGRAWIARDTVLQRAGLKLPELATMSDYAAVLRLTESASAIRHIHKVVLEAGPGERPSVERKALQQALARRRIEARVEQGRTSYLHRVRRADTKPGLVSIVIPSIGAQGHIRTCIESIKAYGSRDKVEIVIVDNLRSATLTDEQAAWKTWFRANADVVVTADEAFNWSRLNNLGAAASSGDYLLFLNDDIEILHADWLDGLIAEAQRPEIGVVGPLLLYPDGKIQHAGMFLSRDEPGVARHAFRFADGNDPGYFGIALSQRNVMCVTGACMMLRREVFDAVGGFDEAHSVVNNDVDFCLRIHRSGRAVLFTPHVRLIHHELASRANLEDIYDKAGFLAVWGDVCLAGDPFHNINISSEVVDYALDEEPLREVYAGHPIGNRAACRRILAIKVDHIGDLVTGLPALRRIKTHFPQAHLTALVGRSAVGLARMEPAIDEIVPFEFFDARSGLGQKKLTKKDYAALEADLHSRNFDLAIDLRKLGDTRLLLQRSGASILAGFDHDGRFPWLDVALEWERDPQQTNKRNHIADDLVNLVDAVANAYVENRWTILADRIPSFSEDFTAAYGDTLKGDYVVVHPASGTPLRQWAPESFARLMDLLIEQDKVNIVLIGGPDEREIADKVLAAMKRPDSVIDIVGRSKLSELPRILACSVMFVGNNSGPSHIAAGLGIPTVSIHSAVIASEEWAPLGPTAMALRRDMNCGPCYIISADQCHRAMACLRTISPFTVYDICRRFLSLRARKPAPVIARDVIETDTVETGRKVARTR